MLKVFISEHDADYHGAVCRSIEKEFQSLADAKKWCWDNSERPYSYLIDLAIDKETKKVVYNSRV